MQLNGLDVVVSEHLPIYPDHREDARRTVRHGRLARQVLEKDGEDVGPAPGEPTCDAISTGSMLIVSRRMWEQVALAAWPQRVMAGLGQTPDSIRFPAEPVRVSDLGSGAANGR